VTASATGAGGAVTTTGSCVTTVSWTTTGVVVTVLCVEPELTGCVVGCGETMLWELGLLDDADVLEVGAVGSGELCALGCEAGAFVEFVSAGGVAPCVEAGADVEVRSRGASLRTHAAGLALAAATTGAGCAAGLALGGATTGAGCATVGMGGGAGAGLATTGVEATACARPLAAGEDGAAVGWLFCGAADSEYVLVTTGIVWRTTGRLVVMTRTTRRLVTRVPGYPLTGDAAEVGEAALVVPTGVEARPESLGTATRGNWATGRERVGTDTSGAVGDSPVSIARSGTTVYGSAIASSPRIANQMRCRRVPRVWRPNPPTAPERCATAYEGTRALRICGCSKQLITPVRLEPPPVVAPKRESISASYSQALSLPTASASTRAAGKIARGTHRISVSAPSGHMSYPVLSAPPGQTFSGPPG